MLKIIAFILFHFLACNGFAQLHGKVYDAITKSPVADANAFLSGTLLSAVTDSTGSFIIRHAGSDKYELVITMIGYETITKQVYGNDTTAFTFLLNPKSKELIEVVINAKADGWKKWGITFMNTFIGTAPLSRYCKIINAEKIRFVKKDHNDTLKAYCNEPIVIENSALGYRIKYKLETFMLDMKKSMVVYAGYPYFEEMQGSTNDIKKWTRNRRDAYEGSILHFMRSLYKHTAASEGFEMQNEAMETNAIKPGENLILKEMVNEKDLAKAIDSNTVAIAFPGYMRVVYTKKDQPTEYLLQKGITGRQSTGYTSDLYLKRGKVISITGNGAYFNPKDITIFGYWAWSQNLCALLPFDYMPD